jgi:Contact-dependent growth inhibition CdiA C-terminal domain
MSTPLKLETADLEGTASAVRSLSHNTTQLSATLNSAWGQLDGGWHSYCREDADGYFRYVMTELKHMEDMLTQMDGALHGTVGLVAVADEEAVKFFDWQGEVNAPTSPGEDGEGGSAGGDHPHGGKGRGPASPNKEPPSEFPFPPTQHDDKDGDDPFHLNDPCHPKNPLRSWLCHNLPTQPNEPLLMLPGVVMVNGKPILDEAKIKQALQSNSSGEASDNKGGKPNTALWLAFLALATALMAPFAKAAQQLLNILKSVTEGGNSSKGKIVAGEGRTLTPEEQKIAEKLASEGHTVEAPAASNKEGERTPDFLVDGVPVELKTISNVTSSDMSGAISSRIRDGAGQAPNIIVDLTSQVGVNEEIAIRAAQRALGSDARLKEIRVIGNGFDTVVKQRP